MDKRANERRRNEVQVRAAKGAEAVGAVRISGCEGVRVKGPCQPLQRRCKISLLLVLVMVKQRKSLMIKTLACLLASATTLFLPSDLHL